MDTTAQITWTVLPADQGDMNQMQPFAPLGNSMPWWKQFVMFGATKAVDNLSRVTVTGNTDPGSFAGQDGQTYSQVPQGSGGGAVRTDTTAGVAAQLTSNPTLLIAGLVVAYLLLKK